MIRSKKGTKPTVRMLSMGALAVVLALSSSIPGAPLAAAAEAGCPEADPNCFASSCPDDSGSLAWACIVVDANNGPNATEVLYPSGEHVVVYEVCPLDQICVQGPIPIVEWGTLYEPGASSYGTIRVLDYRVTYTTDYERCSDQSLVCQEIPYTPDLGTWKGPLGLP